MSQNYDLSGVPNWWSHSGLWIFGKWPQEADDCLWFEAAPVRSQGGGGLVRDSPEPRGSSPLIRLLLSKSWIRFWRPSFSWFLPISWAWFLRLPVNSVSCLISFQYIPLLPKWTRVHFYCLQLRALFGTKTNWKLQPEDMTWSEHFRGEKNGKIWQRRTEEASWEAVVTFECVMSYDIDSTDEVSEWAGFGHSWNMEKKGEGKVQVDRRFEP